MSKKLPQGHATNAKDRRKLGTRIKFGLEDLRQLDATKKDTSAVRASPQSLLPEPAKRPRAASPPDDASSAGVFGSWQEWMLLKDLLFQHTTVDWVARRQALQTARSILNLWKLRSRPALRGTAATPNAVSVPPYVESTVMLLEAQIDDNGQSQASALYCSAVLRAVHMMTGSIVTARSFRDEQTTYRERAKQLNFPEEAVDVRQRIAHGAVPAVNELRWVCALILQNLYLQFWLPQAQHVSSLEQEDSSRREAVERTASRKRLREEAARRHASTADMYALLEDLDARLPECEVPEALAGEVTEAGWLVEPYPAA